MADNEETHENNGVTDTTEEIVDNTQNEVQETLEQHATPDGETNGGHNGDCEEAEAEEEDNDRPVVELFVKAAVDKMKNGSCPICHRYFMIFYVLRERGLIDLVVTTFLPENPPQEVLSFSNGKRYPLVKVYSRENFQGTMVHRGTDTEGNDLSGLECDLPDEIEKLIDKFDCEEMRPRRRGDQADEAERAFENLYPKFKIFVKGGNPKLQDPEPVSRILGRLNFYLKSVDTKFLVGETISKPDCYLLPILQHIRVAGKAYRDFEIPTELTSLWTYLGHAYDSDSFKESCPADREIISHYINLVPSPVIRKKVTLMTDSRTFSVPQQSEEPTETE